MRTIIVTLAIAVGPPCAIKAGAQVVISEEPWEATPVAVRATYPTSYIVPYSYYATIPFPAGVRGRRRRRVPVLREALRQPLRPLDLAVSERILCLWSPRTLLLPAGPVIRMTRPRPSPTEGAATSLKGER